jgi:sialic acid synthase SpsE
MIATAAAAQCDFFKLQCFNTDRLSGKFKPKEKFYNSTQLEFNDFVEVKNKVEKYGMTMMCTVNTPDKIELLRSTNVNNIKIASGQLVPKLIDAIDQHQWDRVFISTGMLDSVERLDLIKQIQSAKEVVVFHAVSLYPQYDCESNVKRMVSLKDYLGPAYTYGYSDHSLDDIACLAAVSLGAEYIERHFMVDNCFGPTSQVCCDGKDLQTLGTLLRRLDVILGDGDLLMQKREQASWDHYKNRFLL